ncbi:MAG: hypothetical protein FWF23_03285, partial [Alphaproteobacteria bacterium]|nr:hypothetical protein [Alphaproteobacteria bacterium]
FEGAKGVTLVSASPMSLEEITQAVSAQTGIPVRLNAARPAARPATPQPPLAGGPQITPPAAAAAGASASEMPISYEGSLSGLLDRLSAFFSVSWRYDGSSIVISRFDTRVFVMEAMPGTHEINDAMEDEDAETSDSSSSASGASSTKNTLKQNSSTKISLKYWEELDAVIKLIIGGNGQSLISPTMGTITVTTTPDLMQTVADYLNKENKRLGRQIAINVKTYVVRMTDGEDFGVQFSATLGKVVDNMGRIATYASAGTPIPAGTAAGALSMALIDSSRVKASAIIEALSSIGNTAQIAEFTVTTMNNRPVARRVGTDTDYIRSVERDQTTSLTNSGVMSYTPVIASVREGFSIQLTPRLMDDGRMLLQYSMGLTGLREMKQIDFQISAEESLPIQLPTTDRRIFIQQSMLRSGQTLVIGGVDIGNTVMNRDGVGTPNNFLLGGGLHGANEKFMMVIALTPQVMDSSFGIEETN